MGRSWSDADAALAYLRTTACRILGEEPPTNAQEARSPVPRILEPSAGSVPLAPHIEPGTRHRSKTETRYATLLTLWQYEGRITRFWYEPFGLRLGARLVYWPDFLVERPGTHLLECVEVKGAWIRDKALHKPKAAATRFSCFVFTLAVWDKQQWTHTRIAAHDA
jgi:hypothetical protein